MGYARKDVEKTKKIAKKFVRYQEGAELYSNGLTKFQELAKEARDEKWKLTSCHTKTMMWMWRNKNRYGENRKTEVGKCKKESVEYPGGGFYV